MMPLAPVCALMTASLISSLLLICSKGRVTRFWRGELLLAALLAPLISVPFSWLTTPACSGSMLWIVCAASPRASSPALRLSAGASAATFLTLLLIVLGAVAHTVSHAVTLARRMEAVAFPANGQLQALIVQLSHRFALATPRLLVLTASEPLAFTYGVWRPTVVLSTWMVEEFDAEELEAVLAHELSHVARRDYPLMLLTTTLRDAFFYLPASRVAYQWLSHEKERACDDLAVARSAQPLALASALTKVWQVAANVRAPAQALTGQGDLLEDRVTRLLATSAAPADTCVIPVTPRFTRRFSLPALGMLVLANGALVALVLSAMGCLRGI